MAKVARSWIAASLGPALALAYVFLLWRWFHDPAASTGEPRATPLAVPVLAFAALAATFAVAHRATITALRAELAEAFRLSRGEGAILTLVIGLSFLFQLPTMLYPAALLHSDAAINGLMGLHIAQGRVAPAFYYGQEFMGTLFSHLLAAIFLATGPLVGGTALLTWIFHAGFLIATFYLVRQAADARVAVAVAVWLAVPPSLLLLILAQTEYPQFLTLSAAAVALVAALVPGRLRHPAWWWVAGGVFGLAFWAHPMAAMVIAAAGLSIVVLLPPRAVVAAAWRLALGFVIGLAPGLVGWGWRLGRFVEWFVQGGGRGGEAPLSASVAGLGTDTLSALLLGREGGGASSLAAIALLAVVVGASLVLVRDALVARRRASPEGPDDAPTAAAASLPLATFVLLQLAVLAARRYADVPLHYAVPLYLGLPAVVAIAASRLLPRGRLKPTPWVVGAVLLWACVLLPGSVSWLRTLPDNQASMDVSIEALMDAGVETCRGPYWDAYRLSYLTLESIVCESIGVRRVPTYAERIESPGGRPPAMVAAPQRAEVLDEHLLQIGERGAAWTRLHTPRFEALLPPRR